MRPRSGGPSRATHKAGGGMVLERESPITTWMIFTPSPLRPRVSLPAIGSCHFVCCFGGDFREGP